MVKRLFCLLAVLAMAGTAGADLLAYYDFSDVMAQPTTENEGTAGTAANGILMNGATIVDIDPDERGVEHVLKLDYGDGTVNQYMDIGKGWANWDPTGLEPFSIAAWIYVTCGTEGGWRTIMSKGWGPAGTFQRGRRTEQGMIKSHLALPPRLAAPVRLHQVYYVKVIGITL